MTNVGNYVVLECTDGLRDGLRAPAVAMMVSVMTVTLVLAVAMVASFFFIIFLILVIAAMETATAQQVGVRGIVTMAVGGGRVFTLALALLR
jgi:hypothetical protein